MALDTHLSSDHETPPPASIDSEPQGYSQPTLPSLDAEPNEPHSFSARFGTKLLGAGLAVVGVLTAGAYAFLPHAEAAMASTPTLTANLEPAFASFSEPVVESACTTSTEHVPLVLYSSIAALAGGKTPTAAEENEMFVDAMPVTANALKVKGGRYAILRTVDLHQPEAAVGEPSPGRFEAVLSVFDASSNVKLCQTVVRTWSSSSLMQHGVATKMLHEDLVNRVRVAVAEGAQRLQIDLDM
jgi:hypothetical protein